MKKIMTSCLCATNTTTLEGVPCEFTWMDSMDCEDSLDYDGDVKGYLEDNLDDSYHILPNVTVHNEPEGAIVVGLEDGTPLEIYWAEPAYWYAVQVDNDCSWDGEGSTDWDEAYSLAEERANEYPDLKVQIATIDCSYNDSFCIDCYTVQEAKNPHNI